MAVSRKGMAALLYLFQVSDLFAAERISDTTLKSYVTDKAPSIQSLSLGSSSIGTGLSQFENKFSSAVFAETHLSESDNPEESSWVKQQAIGWRKNFSFGLSSTVSYAYRYERLSDFLPPGFAGQKVYVPTVGIGIGIDLWKNFLGRYDDYDREILKRELERSELFKRLESHRFHMNLRQLYWMMAVQKQRVSVFRELVANSRRAYEEMRARRRDNVADRGAVANMAANLATTEGNYHSAKIQANALEKEFKVLLPELRGKRIEITANYSQIKRAVNDSVSCAKSMGRLPNVPLDMTEFDDLAQKIEEAFAANRDKLSAYDRMDVNLSVEAASQPFAQEQTAYTALLSVNIPLGGLSRTESLLIRDARMKANIEQSNIYSQLSAVQQQISSNFQLLDTAVKSYRRGIAEQEKAFTSSQRKLRQGRISVLDYITQQTNVLSSRLNMLQIEEQILSGILGYFSVFNQSSCSFNRK
ncbi:MAG: TolC family protein [Pseudobacteriovorax sp.]|nr:TolC family protein [Pseudobacteriovorax sp.]